jgi:16S rRNA (uracil1498-N3)-methyltransferase
VRVPTPLAACLGLAAEHDLALCLWEERGALPLGGACDAAGSPRRIAALIGPEGGLEADEVDAAGRAGWRVASLGPRILRTDTAGPAVIAILQSRFGDLGRDAR